MQNIVLLSHIKMDDSYGWLLRFFCTICVKSWIRVKRVLVLGQEQDTCTGCKESICAYSVSTNRNKKNFSKEAEFLLGNLHQNSFDFRLPSNTLVRRFEATQIQN